VRTARRPCRGRNSPSRFRSTACILAPEPQGQGTLRGTFELTAWPGLRVWGADSAALQNEAAVAGMVGALSAAGSGALQFEANSESRTC
jgi:hypothetical protein